MRGLGGGLDDETKAKRLFGDMSAETTRPPGTPVVRYSPGRDPVFVPRDALVAEYRRIKRAGAALVVTTGRAGSHLSRRSSSMMSEMRRCSSDSSPRARPATTSLPVAIGFGGWT